jgi:hypothetical protein
MNAQLGSLLKFHEKNLPSFSSMTSKGFEKKPWPRFAAEELYLERLGME